MADQLFPHESPLGKRLVVHSFLAEIVGVAGDVHAFGQEADAPDIMYFSVRQMASYLPMSLVVRTQGDPTSLAPSLREILHQLDPSVPLARIATMEQLLDNSRARSAFRTRLLGSFALVALLLAVVGLYGVLAYAVTQRTREIGVRIALGARTSEIFRSIIARGMGLVGLGIIIGVAGALAATRVIAGMLFDVGRTDPLVFAAVTGLLLLAGLAACVVPASRAMRISPVVALKEE
jgi:putative ABC transport system permease protein